MFRPNNTHVHDEHFGIRSLITNHYSRSIQWMSGSRLNQVICLRE